MVEGERLPTGRSLCRLPRQTRGLPLQGGRLNDIDVLVIGGGNAALCAALEAKKSARRVLLLERAPVEFRGGNSRHTRDIRYAHDHDRYTEGVYSDEELLEDLRRVSGGETNETFARLAIGESHSIPTWMEQHGVRWQAPLAGTLHLTRTNLFFLGGGKALINTYYGMAHRFGISILYNSSAEHVVIERGKCTLVRCVVDGAPTDISARAVVLASGGFEANIGWLKRYWGKAADNYIIRGPHYNDGRVLASLLDQGARRVGDRKGFHAVAVDARSPKFDGGIVTRVDSVPFGIAVNACAQRFYDEGEELWPKRYASWGRLVAEQPGQIAYSIFDAKATNLFIPSVYKPLVADSIATLASALQLDANVLQATIDTFNAHVVPGGEFDPSTLDTCHTAGLNPPKSHWARPIDTPPFAAYPLRPGISFTYMGVAIDLDGHVLMDDGGPIVNLFAAGEIMSGNILSKGYLAGFGLTIGTVFGRRAGRGAAAHGGG